MNINPQYRPKQFVPSNANAVDVMNITIRILEETYIRSDLTSNEFEAYKHIKDMLESIAKKAYVFDLIKENKI
jgi:hypothetical protein